MHKKPHKPPQTIVITGASSGIGRALAILYAKAGNRLYLIARNKKRLEDVARICNSEGAAVSILPCDVDDYEAVTRAITSFDEAHPVDLIISNAGISGGTEGRGSVETTTSIEAIFRTNTLAAIHIGQCLFERMKARGYGQIAFTGSIAGFQGWAGAPAYTASKAGLHTYAEALRMLGAADNIKVNIIAPGFVATPMTDKNEFPMPFMISPERAALIIQKQLFRNNCYIIFPLRMYAICCISRLLPESILFRISKLVKGKSNSK